MKDKIAEAVCIATQKTNYSCENIKHTCKKPGICAYCLVMAVELIANGVIILPYNLHLPEELYRHMFDDDYNKVVVKCKVGKNTGYGFTLVHYRDGREWEYKYTSIGKTVFLTKEEAEKALKGGAE